MVDGKPKFEYHESYLKLDVKPDTPQGITGFDPLVTHVELLLYDTNINFYETRVE